MFNEVDSPGGMTENNKNRFPGLQIDPYCSLITIMPELARFVYFSCERIPEFGDFPIHPEVAFKPSSPVIRVVEEIDILVLGNNGDVNYDTFYDTLSSGIFKNTQHVYYKHLCGEFNTASSFGLWLASKILKTQTLPEIVKLNNLDISDFKTILLYNQYRGENHSFTLLKSC